MTAALVVLLIAAWSAALITGLGLGRAAAKPAPWEAAYFNGDDLPTDPDTQAALVVEMATRITKGAAS